MTPRDIVCISTNYWGGEWFRKQQFMSRFARDGHRVLYVEPSHSMIRSAEGRPYVANRHLSSHVERVDERLWVLTPRTMVPFVSRPFVSRLNARLLARQVSVASKELGLRDVCLWVYAVEFASAVCRVPHARVVSDLVDDLVAYEVRADRAAYVRTCTERLVNDSDLSVYTTEGLKSSYPGVREGVVVPNGFDESLFHTGVAPAPELAGMSRVVGFVGTLFRHLDFELFAAVAREVPDVTLVLVGRVSGTEREMEALREIGNVVHIGPVARERVPEFVAGFDVCLVPFKSDAVARNVSPLKAYEYLAMAKRVVSVPMPALAADPAAAGVRFASGGGQFATAVAEALDEVGSDFARDVDANVSSASWEERYASVRRAACEVLECRPEAGL